VDAKELSLEVPKDANSSTYEVDNTPGSERDFSDVLKLYAAWNESVYPDHFTRDAFHQLYVAHSTAMRSGITDPEEQKKTSQTIVQEGQVSSDLQRRLVDFMNYRSDGSNFTYAGKGVKVGNKETPVLWYRTAMAGWRVIYGDLSIKTVATPPTGGEPIWMQGPKIPSSTAEATTKPAQGLP
jgi:hypothetical protein